MSALNWSKLAEILGRFYEAHGQGAHFNKDERYLREAFIAIESLWMDQLKAITSVRFVMLSEAPLWGDREQYVYNPESRFSQFFFKSDLECLLQRKVQSKRNFIDELNNIGFLILDVSPFAFNCDNTVIDYKRMSKAQYRELLKAALDLHFGRKLELIVQNSVSPVRWFYRYRRVKEAIDSMVSHMLLDWGLITDASDVLDISKRGGGIDREKLKSVVRNDYSRGQL